MEILDIFFIHLLFSLLELFGPNYLILSDLFGDLTNKLDEFISLFDTNEYFAVFSEIPELLAALLELLEKESEFPEIQL